MRKTKLLSKILVCFVLITAMLSQMMMPIFAEEQPLYLKEIQISTGKTAKEAQQWLIDNGYTVFNEDLNAGTGKDYAYIGYKTTTNRSEAICDISMMSMDSGYKIMNYAEMIKSTKTGFDERAADFLAALSEFRANLAAGSPNAKIAKETLDIFRAGENDDIPLGDYLLDEARTVADISNILLMTNTLVFTMIYNQVVMGVSDYNQDGADGAIKTWMDRWVENAALLDSLSEDELEALDDLYYSKAEKLEYSIKDFMKNLYDAMDRAENGTLGEGSQSTVSSDEDALSVIGSIGDGTELNSADMDMLLFAVQETLEEYAYGEVDICWSFDDYYQEKDVRFLYPLVMSLTDGQLSMMQISGVVNMTVAAQNTEEVYNAAKEQLDIYSVKLIEENNGQNPSVFLGVNKALYSEEVGLTSEAARVATTSANYNELTQENVLHQNLKTYLKVCAGVSLAAAGVVIITSSVVGGIVGAGGFMASLTCIATSTMATVGSFFVSMATFIPAAIAIVAVVAVVVILTIWMVDVIKAAWNDKHPEYTKIPRLMYDYDAEEKTYVEYEAVKERGGEPGDINCFQARRWNALYVSYDETVGSPITANEMGEFFRIKRGDPTVVDKYDRVSNFGEINAVNLNSYTYKDRVNGIYMFYTTENSLAGITEERQSGRYLYSLMVATNKDAEAAKLEIKNKKDYELLDVNLTPGQKNATYLGYQTINSRKEAITDIRIAWSVPEDSDIKYGNGGAAYAAAGTYAQNTSLQGISFYYTKDSANGEPILADFFVSHSLDDIPEGYEPVNMFSGGPAFNLNYSSNQESEDWDEKIFLYFRYDTPYTGEAKYLGGLAFVELGVMKTYTMTNGKSPTLQGYAEELGWKMFDADLKAVNNQLKGYAGLRLCYTTTNNPKRAIYDIRTYTAEPKAQQVLPNINFDGTGFVSAERFIMYEAYQLGTDKISVATFHRTFSATHSFLEDTVSGVDNGGSLLTVGDTRNKVPTKLYGGTALGMETETMKQRCIGLYVSGPTSYLDANENLVMKSPILVSELYLGSKEDAPENLKAVVDFTDVYGENAVDMSATRGIYLCYNQVFPEKLKYIQSIEVVYSQTENFSHDDAKLQLLAGGGHEILNFNLASVSGSIMYDSGAQKYLNDYENRAAFIRVTRTKTKAKAMKDIRIYRVGEKDAEPADSLTINGLTYKKLSNRIQSSKNFEMLVANLGGKEVINTSDKSYFYIYGYTGGSGVALTDISFNQAVITNGTYTVLDQNNKSDYNDPWWMHLHSSDIDELKATGYMSKVGVVCAGTIPATTSAAKYNLSGVKPNSKNIMYSEILNQGFTQFLSYDFNDGTEEGKPVYIGFSYEKDPKKAITNLITSSKNASTITVNGITYTRGTSTSLNASLNYGDNIYLYYTTDARAGALITKISGAKSTASGSEYLQRAEGGISNLNLNAADKNPDCKKNDYLPALYLKITRDGAANKNASLSASVFAENPQMKLIIVMAGMAVLIAAVTVIIKKRKAKLQK